MVPVARLEDERHRVRTATTEEDRVDWYARGVFPLRGDRRVLTGGRGEARVRVRGWRAEVLAPLLALPVREAFGRFTHAFPPDVIVFRESDVGKDGVRFDRVHGVGVGLHVRTRRDPEESRLGVDGVEAAVGSWLHPADVVTDGFDLPTRKSGHQHREVGLAARARERARHVTRLTARIG